ncbi:MAG: exodeoxyribonuclease VII small subunit [Eubacterium sp.]|nr:exodeoxyribonuclease VII small subunit [Eubacterium sp.]MBR1675006.1 exodeoxyribonuclease VII small subunit [Eubacterium sp.]
MSKKSENTENEKFIVEDAFARLEEIITALEAPETKLSDAMELYKEGVVLSDKCRENLEGVEKEIKILNAEEE